MQTDIKALAAKNKIKLQWHGPDTLLRVDGVKVEIKTGATVEVSTDQATQLCRQDDRWTPEGEKPVVQPFRTAEANALKARDAEAAKEARDLARRKKQAETEKAKRAEGFGKPEAAQTEAPAPTETVNDNQPDEETAPDAAAQDAAAAADPLAGLDELDRAGLEAKAKELDIEFDPAFTDDDLRGWIRDNASVDAAE